MGARADVPLETLRPPGGAAPGRHRAARRRGNARRSVARGATSAPAASGAAAPAPSRCSCPTAGKPDEIAKVSAGRALAVPRGARSPRGARGRRAARVRRTTPSARRVPVSRTWATTRSPRSSRAHPDRQRGALRPRGRRSGARAAGAVERCPTGCIVASRAFDEDLLLWEIDHFREWALEARGRRVSPRRPRHVRRRRRSASRAASPAGRAVFVHRDYQSRNLMVRGRRADGEATGGPSAGSTSRTRSSARASTTSSRS